MILYSLFENFDLLALPTAVLLLFLAFLAPIILEKLECKSLWINCALVFSACGCSWYQLFHYREPIMVDFVPWLIIGDFRVFWSVLVDKLTVIMFITVTTVSLVVHIYSLGYMQEEPGKKRFFSYLSLFTLFMLVLIGSKNLVQMLVGWEGVGLCSYLLIGFWFEKESATDAAIKAFIVNRVADIFLILGLALIWTTFSSFDFSVINNKVMLAQIPPARLELIGILILIGCMAKSAQIGLHTWLADAMEGPTPVSALIHAATMVTAGVFLLARIAPILEYTPICRKIIMVVGLSTALMAPLIATMQTDIKKIIAYSTSGQLGYMFAACGASAYGAAIFHLFTHAFFKALLFLAAGNIIYFLSHEQDVRKMGGIWRKAIFTYIMMWIGSLAITGIFPFAGFFSKDMIIENLHGFPHLVAMVVVCITSYYSWRLVMRVFHGKEKHSEEHHLPKVMYWSLIPLALGSLLAGIIGHYYFYPSEFWYSKVKGINEVHISPWPLLSAILGAALALMADKIKISSFGFLRNLIRNKFYFDELYHLIFTRPVYWVSVALADRIDRRTIDKFGPGGAVSLVQSFSNLVPKLQSGYIFHYVLFMTCALLGMVWWTTI